MGLSDDEREFAKIYIKAMRSVVGQGAGYIPKEAARLRRLIQSADVKPEKRRLLRVRFNVLRAFGAAAEGGEGISVAPPREARKAAAPRV